MNTYTTSGSYLFATQPPSEPERKLLEGKPGYVLKVYLETKGQPIFRILVELPEGVERDDVRDVVIPGLILAADASRWDDPEIQEHCSKLLDAAYTNLLIRCQLPERN